MKLFFIGVLVIIAFMGYFNDILWGKGPGGRRDMCRIIMNLSFELFLTCLMFKRRYHL